MGCASSAPEQTKIKNPKGSRDFSVIDSHARKTPKSEEESTEKLAIYLTKSAKDDIDKVRALYVWVCENISYDVDSLFNGRLPSQDSENIMKSRKAVCEGFASLFHSLCQATGIECKKISGYSKGFGHRPGDVISYSLRTDPAWNAVHVNGKWQFIETTWGSGYLNERNQLVSKFTDFYFLTSPKDFIVDHFPYMDNDKDESSKWQLLPNPITVEQFSKALKPTHFARQSNVDFPDTPYEVISCSATCQFRIVCKSMIIRKTNILMFDQHGSCMDCAVIIREGISSWRVIIHPKHKGTFTVRIFGGEIHSNPVPCLVEMCLKADVDIDGFAPFPPSDKSYGPVSEISDFDDEKFPLPLYECKDRKVKLNIPTKIYIKAIPVLMDCKGRQISNSIDCNSSGKSIQVTGRLSGTGYFRLILMSNSGSGSQYNEAFNLLLFAT